MKKYVTIFLVLLCGVFSAEAQEQTDLTIQQIRRYANHDFSASRTFTLHSEVSPAYNCAFKQDGRTVEEGKMNKNNTTKFTTIIPVWTVNKFRCRSVANLIPIILLFHRMVIMTPHSILYLRKSIICITPAWLAQLIIPLSLANRLS